MRSNVLLAAVIGAVAGALAGWLAASAHAPELSTPPSETSARGDDADARGVAARTERLERSLAAATASIDRLAARIGDAGPARVPEAAHSVAEPGAAAERPGRAAPPVRDGVQPVRDRAFDGVTTDDLEMEADERHGGNQDSTGAVRRYRTLLARGGTAPQMRRWWLRLGDCLLRVDRRDGALDAYRTAIRASDDDSYERYCCIRFLANDAFRKKEYDAALAWNDQALQSQFVDFEAQCNAVDWAKTAGYTDRERAGLRFLIATYPDHEWCPNWRTWVDGLASK